MSHHEPQLYEFRVERQLGPALAAQFPELTAAYEGGETVLRGALPDQAALHGVLMRIRDLGLTLVAVSRRPPHPPATIQEGTRP